MLDAIDFTFESGTTPKRTFFQPALRVQTDENFKLIKFIDPAEAEEGDPEDNIANSFINKLGIDGKSSVTSQPLYFTAFARADKRINNFGEEGSDGPLSGAFFQNITSNNVRFVIDGSGSMSACVMWSEEYGPWRTYYNPSRGRYEDTKRICALTRMEALISEMTMILRKLPSNTKIGITAFSSSNYTNNKSWDQSKGKLARIGDTGIRDSAINFVNTLDDPKVTRWGGTDPWNAISEAFQDNETDTLYLMSDGQPNRDRWGGNWSSKDNNPTANYFSGLNDKRKFDNKDQPLIVNSTSLGIDSTWMQKLSQKTQGYYNRIDKETFEEGDATS